jgi:hypothetical protein
MANPATVTLSSVGNSAAINLDWRSGAHTAFSITGSSSGTFSVVAETTLDDLQLVSTPSWVAQSSAITADSSVWQLVGPYAGLRLNASAVSSAVLTLTVLQDHGY